MLTSIIIPTYCRPTQLRRNVERLMETVKGHDTEIVIAAEVDRRSVAAMDGLPVRVLFQEEWQGSVAGWNRGAASASGDLLVTGADDVWWHDGWLDAVLEAMGRAETCYVGLNDTIWDGRSGIVTHWAITRAGARAYTGGCLHIPAYKTAWTDIEVKARMVRAGQFAWAPKAVAEHRHYMTGAAHVDKCYLVQKQHMDPDGETYKAREAAGFPDDFSPVIGARPAYMDAPGWDLQDAERRLLRGLAAQVRPGGHIVNIGIALGASCHCLAAGARGARITAIDIDADCAGVLGPWHTVIGDSAEAAAGIGPVALVFVDGDHEYNGVAADIRAWGPLVEPGGLMVFHDYGNGHLPQCRDVRPAVDALMGDGWKHAGDTGSIRAFRRTA